MLPRYEPSGKMSPLLFVVLPFSAAAVVAMAAAYTWVMVFLPVKFIVVLVAAVLALAGLALAASWTIRLGRTRSLGAASLSGIGLGAIFVVATFASAWALHPQGRAAGAGAGDFFREVRQQGVQVFGRKAGSPTSGGSQGGVSGFRIKGGWLTTLWVF